MAQNNPILDEIGFTFDRRWLLAFSFYVLAVCSSRPKFSSSSETSVSLDDC